MIFNYNTQGDDFPIIFDKGAHTYTNKNTGEVYPGFTAFFKNYYKPFDEDGQLLRGKAKKLGITPEELDAQWTKTRNESTEFGSFVHDNIEEHIKEGKHDPEADKYVQAWNEYATKNLAEFELYSEFIVYSETLKASGTADIVAVDHSKKTVHMRDFKTNKSLEFFSKYNDFLLGPLSHLSDCKYIKYTLQMSFYMRLLLRMPGYEGYTCGSIIILYWDRKKEEFVEIPCPYMKCDVEGIMMERYLKYN